MAGALVLSLTLQFGVGLDPDDPHGFAWLMLGTVAGTTTIWLAVTFLTPAEPLPHLQRFYAKVAPGGPGWRAVAGEAVAPGPGLSGLFHWALGCVVVYLGLFGIGSLLLGRPARGLAFVAGALLLTGWVVKDLSRRSGVV